MPDDPEPEYDDEEDENPKKPLGGSIFGFSSAPKDDNKSSLFSNGADKTWSPDTGIKFSTTGLFPPATANGGGMFGGATAKPAAAPASSAGFFGSSKPTPVASVTTSASASESEDPSDVVPPHKNESNLSQQGPGEEDEDSLFQAKSVFYAVVTGGPLKKEGAGMLRVLKNRITGKGRVVIRTDVGKVLLNVGLAKDVKYVLQDNGLVRIPQFKEDGVVEKTWGIKVKDQKALREAVEKGKGE